MMRGTNNPCKEMEHQTERLLDRLLPSFADYDIQLICRIGVTDGWQLGIDIFSFDYDGVVFGPYRIDLPFAYDDDTVRMTYDTRQSIEDAIRRLDLPAHES